MSKEIYKTKFRAFQLDSEGSLFSYYSNNRYILIEARVPKGGIEVLRADLLMHSKDTINLLHITSWDTDHCNYNDLVAILNEFRPARIEVPSYDPESVEGKLCQRVIMGYDKIHEKYVPNVVVVSEQYIRGLSNAGSFGTNNVIYRSSYDGANKNDMSLIKLFRSEGFSVLSVGDCESKDIADRLMECSILKTEVDVLILPHHGANNGFLSGKFLDRVKPQLAICSSNYDNQYEHPRPEICQMLHERGIRMMTTKTGDVFVYQKQLDAQVTAANIKGNNTILGATAVFTSKRVNASLSVA